MQQKYIKSWRGGINTWSLRVLEEQFVKVECIESIHIPAVDFSSHVIIMKKNKTETHFSAFFLVKNKEKEKEKKKEKESP